MGRAVSLRAYLKEQLVFPGWLLALVRLAMLGQVPWGLLYRLALVQLERPVLRASVFRALA